MSSWWRSASLRRCSGLACRWPARSSVTLRRGRILKMNWNDFGRSTEYFCHNRGWQLPPKKFPTAPNNLPAIHRARKGFLPNLNTLLSYLHLFKFSLFPVTPGPNIKREKDRHKMLCQWQDIVEVHNLNCRLYQYSIFSFQWWPPPQCLCRQNHLCDSQCWSRSPMSDYIFPL